VVEDSREGEVKYGVDGSQEDYKGNGNFECAGGKGATELVVGVVQPNRVGGDLWRLDPNSLGLIKSNAEATQVVLIRKPSGPTCF
jgi:hypothetical protein